MNFDEELENILKDDPLGLLVVKPKTSGVMTTDARLKASFDEINSFIKKNGREPKQSRDIGERKLYSRLKGIRENREKVLQLLEYDEHGLLKGVELDKSVEINNIDDVLKHDALGLLDDGLTESENIHKLKYVRKKPSAIEDKAQREVCKDFEVFEPIFKQTHTELESGKKNRVSFDSEKQIEEGSMFVLNGMLVYVAKVGEKQKQNFGNVNARLYCVFENGTESKLLLRSLASALWKDKLAGEIVDATDKELFDSNGNVTKDDKATGYVYVLKSLSEDPKISQIKDLYKIGYSKNPVANRIANADQEPTYLMADVELVSQFQTFNVDPQRFEALLHRFFGKVCLEIDVFDAKGKRYTPREWFLVPFGVVETTVKLIINEEIVNYEYDAEEQCIAPKEK